MRRAIIAVLTSYLVLLGIGLGIGAFVHHQRSIASFAVDIPTGATVKIFRDQGGDAPFQYDPSKPLFTLHSDETVKTKVGVYDFVITGGASDYATTVSKTIVNKATSRVTINPTLSQAKLQSELSTEKPLILAALGAKFGDLGTYYTVSKVALYEHGDWAGVVLHPTFPQYDPARVVLTKKDGAWTVVNDPAIYVIGSLNKNIPSAVVSAINAP